jgi:trk system potassium uptake protein TrkA
MGRFVVVGLGSFGVSVARTLEQLGHEVIAIERDGVLVDRYADIATRVVQGDATDPHVLKAVGAAGADAAIIGTSETLATSILATVALRDIGVRDVYAKAASDAEARALDALGVTDAILADHDAGVRLAHRISSRGCLEYVPIAEGVSLQEMPVPATWIGKSLRALAPRGELGVQVIAVRDALTESLAVPPDPDAVLKDSDALVVVGSDEVLVTLQRRR